MDVLKADPDTLELRLGASSLRPAQARALLAAALCLALLPLAALVWLLGLKIEREPGDPTVLETIWTEFMQDPVNQAALWAAAVLLAAAIAFLWRQRLAWLRVTPTGLEAYLPRWLGLPMLRQTAGHWTVRWDEVRRVHLVYGPVIRRYGAAIGNAGQRLNACRLVIETAQGEVRVAAFRWFDDAGHDHRLGLGELFRLRDQDVARRLRSAPLVRAIAARGLEIGDGAAAVEAGPSGFDLTQHKGLLLEVAILFIAGLYALGDALFVRAYLPLGSLPVLPFVATAVAATFAVSRLGRGAPAVERRAVGALAVIACVGAAYPAILRYNAATAEAEIVDYVSLGGGRFESPYSRLPAIDLAGEGVAEYWEQYPPGAEHEFTLLRGGAGFYQLELAPLHERTRQFYAER